MTEATRKQFGTDMDCHTDHHPGQGGCTHCLRSCIRSRMRSAARSNRRSLAFFSLAGTVALLQALRMRPNRAPVTTDDMVARDNSPGQTLLRLDWTDLPPRSELARRIDRSQTRCSEGLSSAGAGGARLKKHIHFVGGVGMNIHTWAQSLCHAVENDLILLTRGKWKWMDDDSCPEVAAEIETGVGNAMRCYFGPHVDGGSREGCYPPLGRDNEFAYISTTVPECGTCPGIVNPEQNTVGDWMAAATEFLFQSVSPAIIEEAQRQVRAVFPKGLPDPENIVTVNIRWGDKWREMKLQPIYAYIQAVREMAKTRSEENLNKPLHVYLATEDPDALRKFLAAAPKDWRIHVSGPLQDGKSKSMWNFASGKNGLGSLAALLISMEANRYVLTTGSNWSRLINELRKNVVDPRCSGCTSIIDLSPGEWPTMFPNGTISWESYEG